MNIESPFDYIHDDDDNENNNSGDDGVQIHEPW